MEVGARHRRRTAFALVVSLLGHVALVWLLRSPETPPPPARTPLELTNVEWVETAAPKTAAATGGTSAPPKKKRVAPKPKTTPPLQALVTEDVPKRLDLSTGDLPIVVERPRGATLYPGDLPTREEELADTEARVEERVQGLLKEGLARARADKGLVDPAYGALGAALREATDDVPPLVDTDSPGEVGKAFAGAWLNGAERYGKTGAPYAEPEGRQEFIERPSSLEFAAQNGNVQARQLQQFLYAGARMQEFADGKTGLELYALVEVHQLNSGAIDSVSLLRPSGLRPFDTWVMERTNGLQLAFTWDAGARKKPLRSVWRFDGIMKFRRKVKLSELNGRAVVGMIAMSVLGSLTAAGDGAPRMPALSGRFDEMTGEMDLIDFTNPTYDCKVTLLEAD